MFLHKTQMLTYDTHCSATYDSSHYFNPSASDKQTGNEKMGQILFSRFKYLTIGKKHENSKK